MWSFPRKRECSLQPAYSPRFVEWIRFRGNDEWVGRSCLPNDRTTISPESQLTLRPRGCKIWYWG
jgi:hypothetical protein